MGNLENEFIELFVEEFLKAIKRHTDLYFVLCST